MYLCLACIKKKLQQYKLLFVQLINVFAQGFPYKELPQLCLFGNESMFCVQVSFACPLSLHTMHRLPPLPNNTPCHMLPLKEQLTQAVAIKSEYNLMLSGRQADQWENSVLTTSTHVCMATNLFVSFGLVLPSFVFSSGYTKLLVHCQRMCMMCMLSCVCYIMYVSQKVTFIKFHLF